MNFQIGDWVYAADWCYGQIIDIDEDSVWIEFETAGGGGTWAFDVDQVRLAEGD